MEFEYPTQKNDVTIAIFVCSTDNYEMDARKNPVVRDRSANTCRSISDPAPFFWPLVLLGVAAIAAQTVRMIVPLTGWEFIWVYLKMSLSSVFLFTLVWLFIEFFHLAKSLQQRPIHIALEKFRTKIDLLFLPGVLFPLFLACYTTIKQGIPDLVGYGWDRYWADFDKAFLGRDAWDLSWNYLPHQFTQPLQIFYTMVWGGGLVFSGIIVAFYCQRKTVGRFFTSLMILWIIGGSLMAYLTSAAGPIFVHIVDPSLADRFQNLHQTLSSALKNENPIILTQKYLANVYDNKIIGKGAGISAMPSMHVGTSAILVAVSWNKLWLRFIAIISWTLTLIGSVHFGYHYLLDGIIATIIAVVAWRTAEKISQLLPTSFPPPQQTQA